MQIVGAGLAGPLLALLLAQRGRDVTLLERGGDPRSDSGTAGRSINLALAARGLRALDAAGLSGVVAPLLLPMRGRMLHEGQTAQLQVYGLRRNEVIYSVSRAELNRALITAAAAEPRITLRFGQQCIGVQPTYNTLHMREVATGHAYSLALRVTIATDGGGSTVRHALQAGGLIDAREDLLDHSYKELTIPPRQGEFALSPDALHIWPRGGFMLIALPNRDRSFTATLFLARQGVDGFESLRTAAHIRTFFAREFPSAHELMPNLTTEFAANPAGLLGTVHCSRWHFTDQLLLLGDAAHAIVPFHGQGMNCAFEDCIELADLLDNNRSVAAAFSEFAAQRQPNTAAIATMALENYTEMRASVLDPKFQRLKSLSLQLEQRFPQRFIPRYSMVMFHPEISYGEALRRGRVQSGILEELDGAAPGGDIDWTLAKKLIEARL